MVVLAVERDLSLSAPQMAQTLVDHAPLVLAECNQHMGAIKIILQAQSSAGEGRVVGPQHDAVLFP